MAEQFNVTVVVSSAKLTAADIAAKTGLVPDAQWAAGAAYGAFGAIREKHGIQLESKETPTTPINDHVLAMIKRLAPSAQKLGALGADVETAFACKVQGKRAPFLHFDKDTLRWLAVMNAKLDIDTAVIPDPPKPAAGGAKPAESK
jgi:hypothetical protein